MTTASALNLNWKIMSICTFCICACLAVFYVWQIDGLTRGSFLINNYERQINSLAKQNQNLQVSFAESSFWGEAMEKISALNFQKAGLVKYVQIPDSAVAYNAK